MEKKSSVLTTYKNTFSINPASSTMLTITNHFRIALKPTATIPSSLQNKMKIKKIQPQRKVSLITIHKLTAVELGNQVM